MGALIGGIFAAGKLAEFKEWAVSLQRNDMFRMVDFTFGGNGLIKGEKVLTRIQEFVPDAQIEDLPIPYSATAVDLTHREEVVFTKGSLFNAIRASIAIPSVFTPITNDETILVDGGVMNNLPISNVKRTNGDSIVARRFRLLSENIAIDLWYSESMQWLALQTTTESGNQLRYQLEQLPV